MTFGIDVSGFQAGIDFVNAKQQGVEFVIVKASGFNTGTLYVASGYHTHIDRAVAAGLPKGHYYLTGGGKTPTEQARWFVDNLYEFDPASDVLMLDNERLDSNGYLFTDAEATEFAVEVIRLTGVAPKRVWHYAGASDYRRAGSWPLLEQAGVRYVWAAYGDRPTGQTPDHEPSLQGSIPRWDVHQFTSSYQMPGWSGALDGLFSRHTITDLFGGVASMEDQMRAYIAANRKPYDAATWDQMCGSLMYRFNSWRGWVREPMRDISSAYRVAVGSSPLSTDFTRAPVGAWHYFDIAGPGNGHVMQDARGGGLVCLSTGYALSESLGNAIGFQSVPGYVAAKGARYMGWATNYAGGTISVAGTAGGGGTIIEGFLMALTDAQQAELYNAVINMQGYLWKGGDSVNRGIGDPGSVFGRIMDAQRQLTGANGFYKDINAISRLADIQAKLAALSSGGVDSDALSSQISAKVLAGLGESGGQGAPSVTLAQIEEAFGRALKSLVLRAE